MNVDVSPDGRRIVFDLLGDLYTMPIEGSGSGRPRGSRAARRSTCSRDSVRTVSRSRSSAIAAGCSTCGWPMPMAQHARQISKEQRWWMNSPTWSPDGQYIFARRHFVGERSLGAGEVWMFHVSGSDGVQVTERASIQKDAGEPALSPDGKHALLQPRRLARAELRLQPRSVRRHLRDLRARSRDRPRADGHRSRPADRSRRASRRTASASSFIRRVRLEVGPARAQSRHR